jgi:hypothetical protein
MTIDRKKLLEGWLRSKAMLSHPDQEVRNLAKKALDHAEVALGHCSKRALNRCRRLRLGDGKAGAYIFPMRAENPYPTD